MIDHGANYLQAEHSMIDHGLAMIDYGIPMIDHASYQLQSWVWRGHPPNPYF
ncbi:hypothetical protein LguiA_036463 [Lonicera macranthoides]